MTRCVSRAIFTGIYSFDFIRDIGLSVALKQTELESSNKMTKETAQFTQFANSRARYIFKLLDSQKREMTNLSCQEDEILLHKTNVDMDVFEKNIEHTIRNKIAPGKPLHQVLCYLYDSVASRSRPDLQQYVDCIRDLANVSASFFNADFQTTELENIAVEMMSKSRYGIIPTTDQIVELYTSKLTTAAGEIMIGTIITKFSEFLCNKLDVFSQETNADGNYCGDVQILEATINALTSAWSEIIRGMLQYRIIRSVMFDIQKRTNALFASMKNSLSFEFPHFRRITKLSSDLSTRLKEYNKEMKQASNMYVTDARIISKRLKRNISILDVDKNAILTISSHDIRDSIELIYNPPCLGISKRSLRCARRRESGHSFRDSSRLRL